MRGPARSSAVWKAAVSGVALSAFAPKSRTFRWTSGAGFAAAREYDIERKWREARLYQIAPISTNMILAYLGQHVLGMPRSY